MHSPELATRLLENDSWSLEFADRMLKAHYYGKEKFDADQFAEKIFEELKDQKNINRWENALLLILVQVHSNHGIENAFILEDRVRTLKDNQQHCEARRRL